MLKNLKEVQKMRRISNCFEQEKNEEILSERKKEKTTTKKKTFIIILNHCLAGLLGFGLGFGAYYIYYNYYVLKPWWKFW